jgi:CubicO group peptidase (beta-lactamase class C family)
MDLDIDTPAEPLLPSTGRALLHRIAVAQAEDRAPSLVAAVVRDGHPVWTGSRSCVEGHTPDPDTQYRIGSITKTFVAVLVMRLRDEGLLRLSDRLDQHLTGLAEDAGAATVGQLLSHTSGLTSEPPGPWWERTPGTLRPGLADVLQQPATRHPAGRVHHYSNVGFALLGALVEQLRGEPWTEVLRREALEPLGLTRTTPLPQHPHAGGWAVHPWADVLLPEPTEDTGRMAPAGQLWSTVGDLCRWAVFLADGDDRVLAPATLAEMRERESPEADGQSHGLGLALLRAHGLSYAGHTGSMPGFLAAVWVVPGERLAAVALANTTSITGGGIGALVADLLRITAEHEPRLPEPWRPLPAVDPELLALTGTWYWGPAAFTLRLKADRALELGRVGNGSGAVRLRPEADGTWTALDDYWQGETLRVVRGADGDVSHLDLGTFVLTREPYPVAGPVPGGVDPDGWKAL